MKNDTMISPSINKIKGSFSKTVFSCPLCNSKHSNHSEADDCLDECVGDRFSVSESVVSTNVYRCFDCKKEFLNYEDAMKHPWRCLLVAAAVHPSQKKLLVGER